MSISMPFCNLYMKGAKMCTSSNSVGCITIYKTFFFTPSLQWVCRIWCKNSMKIMQNYDPVRLYTYKEPPQRKQLINVPQSRHPPPLLRPKKKLWLRPKSSMRNKTVQKRFRRFILKKRKIRHAFREKKPILIGLVTYLCYLCKCPHNLVIVSCNVVRRPTLQLWLGWRELKKNE